MTESTQTPQTQLLQKLLEVAKAIPYFEKGGYNAHHKYKFVQAMDVVRQVRTELFDRGLLVFPGATGGHHLPFGEDSKGKHLTTVTLSYTFFDTETGESIILPWIGVGADTGGDKGIYKAYTGGLKYALLALTLAPMSDDPERDNLTETSEPEKTQKDSARPANPTIPQDRAADILRRAVAVDHAKYDWNVSEPPEFSPTFRALLAVQDVTRIGSLTVDSAEAVEAWLRNEESQP